MSAWDVKKLLRMYKCGSYGSYPAYSDNHLGEESHDHSHENLISDAPLGFEGHSYFPNYRHRTLTFEEESPFIQNAPHRHYHNDGLVNIRLDPFFDNFDYFWVVTSCSSETSVQILKASSWVVRIQIMTLNFSIFLDHRGWKGVRGFMSV